MPHFATEKTFLFRSFDMPLKERDRIDAFLQILELSVIGEIIEKATKKSMPQAGVHVTLIACSPRPRMLFPSVLEALGRLKRA